MYLSFKIFLVSFATQAYALIAKGVRIVCTNTTSKSAKSVVLKTQGSGSLKDNVITLFGMSTFNCLEPATFCLSDSCKVEGFLSKSGNGSGRHMGDRQFFFVNCRPVDMPKVTKLVNELYRGANSQQHPIAIMNFTIPTRACDVNVTPDKRKVFFSDESSMLHALRESLQQIYSPNNARYTVHKIEEPTRETSKSELCSPLEKSHFSSKSLSQGESVHEERDVDCTPESDAPLKTAKSDSHCILDKGHIHENTKKSNFTLRVHSLKKIDDCRSLIGQLENTKTPEEVLSSKIANNGSLTNHVGCIQSSINKFVTVNKRKHENINSVLSEMPLLRNQTNYPCNRSSVDSETNAAISKSPISHPQVDDSTEGDEREPSKYLKGDKIMNKIVNPLSSGGNTYYRKHEEVRYYTTT